MSSLPRPVVPEILPGPGARRWVLGESHLGVVPDASPSPPPVPAEGEFVVTPPPSEPAPADSPKE